MPAYMDDEDLHKLLRLKRYEQPDEVYFDGFLREFHRRQRQDALKRSSISLFFERLNTYLADPRSQGWAYAPVLAVFVVAFYSIIGTTDNAPVPAVGMVPVVSVAPAAYLNSGQIIQASWPGPTMMMDNQRPMRFQSEVCVPGTPETVFARINIDLQPEDSAEQEGRQSTWQWHRA